MGVIFKSILLLFISNLSWAVVPAKTEVLIIGAGLSGLATGYELKKSAVKYHILELTPRVGGRVRTVTYKIEGQTLTADSGMEEYWESNPAVRVLKELKLPIRSDVSTSSIVLQKKLEPLGTEEPRDYLLRVLGKDGFESLEAFKKKVTPIVNEIRSGNHLSSDLLAMKNTAFSKWVFAQGVLPRVAEWIRISIECEVGTSWDRISALDGIAEFHIFLGNGGNGEKSYQVIGGNEKFTDAFAKAVGSQNISVNKRVNRIVSKNGKVFVYYLDSQTNVSSVVEANAVVSTIPLFRLFEVQIEPPLSEQKQQAISSQSWGAYFKAHIFLPKSAEKYWTKSGVSFLPILSDSELGVIYDGNPDQKTETRIVSLLITGSFAEAFNMMPLDQVRTTIKTGLEKMWPGISSQIKGIEFYRYHPKAIAAWPVGRSRFDEFSEAIRNPENGLYFAGDFTETSHSDGAFISAERVVKQILASRTHK